ncbi:MAG: hypothetical protein M3522_01480 [Actinomycetota bacterium]|jgi:hypothetical protein|nr:hypothetical protein [Actinomycetota bacterium]
MSDLYDALQRRHEERQRAADGLAEALGLGKEATGETPAGLADAGDHTPPPTPDRRAPGDRLRDLLLHGDAGDEYEPARRVG